MGFSVNKMPLRVLYAQTTIRNYENTTARDSNAEWRARFVSIYYIYAVMDIDLLWTDGSSVKRVQQKGRSLIIHANGGGL